MLRGSALYHWTRSDPGPWPERLLSTEPSPLRRNHAGLAHDHPALPDRPLAESRSLGAGGLRARGAGRVGIGRRRRAAPDCARALRTQDRSFAARNGFDAGRTDEICRPPPLCPRRIDLLRRCPPGAPPQGDRRERTKRAVRAGSLRSLPARTEPRSCPKLPTNAVPLVERTTMLQAGRSTNGRVGAPRRSN